MPADAFISELEQRVQALAAKRRPGLRVSKELDELAKYIANAKAEFAALCPANIRDHHLPAATD